MILKRIDRHYDSIREIRRLYDASFPDDERIPFSRLLNTLSQERVLYACQDDDNDVGLLFLFIDEDLIYLSYIAVEENRRHHGYGSHIIEALRKLHPDYRIVLDIEEVIPDSDNYQERKSRRDFYIHNGFESTGIYYHIYGVDYELLACNGSVTQSQWHKLIRKHWGSFADTAIYRITQKAE